jgi:hypothetical protein
MSGGQGDATSNSRQPENKEPVWLHLRSSSRLSVGTGCVTAGKAPKPFRSSRWWALEAMSVEAGLYATSLSRMHHVSRVLRL